MTNNLSQSARRIAFLALVAAAALVLNPPEAGAQPSSNVSEHPWIGKQAPDFSLEKVAGGKLGLKDLRGKYVVIHFGASW